MRGSPKQPGPPTLHLLVLCILFPHPTLPCPCGDLKGTSLSLSVSSVPSTGAERNTGRAKEGEKEGGRGERRRLLDFRAPHRGSGEHCVARAVVYFMNRPSGTPQHTLKALRSSAVTRETASFLCLNTALPEDDLHQLLTSAACGSSGTEAVWAWAGAGN